MSALKGSAVAVILKHGWASMSKSCHRLADDFIPSKIKFLFVFAAQPRYLRKAVFQIDGAFKTML